MRAQAIPSRPAAIRPRMPARSSIARSTNDTITETSAHGVIAAACRQASEIALLTVGSPPVIRSSAAHTRATLKKIVMYDSR